MDLREKRRRSSKDGNNVGGPTMEETKTMFK